MKILITLMLTLSFNLFAVKKFAKCKGTDVQRRHEYAVLLVEQTAKAINDSNHELMEGALRHYFKLSLYDKRDTNLVSRVFENIINVSKKASFTNYRCHQRNDSVWCNGKVTAIVPPPKRRVHLCPNFFNRTTSTSKTATIIHEWFHLWGKKNINYLKETYCKHSRNLSAKELIRNADQYMLFIYYVGSGGRKKRCF